jgi:hypothetical protein
MDKKIITNNTALLCTGIDIATWPDAEEWCNNKHIEQNQHNDYCKYCQTLKNAHFNK